MKYTGKDAAWISGIPARDLSAAEWAALTPDQQQHALSSGLYVAAPAIEAGEPPAQSGDGVKRGRKEA